MKLSWSIQTFGTAFLGHTAYGSGSMVCTSSCEEEDFTAKSEADKDKFLQRERVIRRALEIVQEAPDLREDRIQAARRALADGTLPLDGATLAEKLLQHARRR